MGSEHTWEFGTYEDDEDEIMWGEIHYGTSRCLIFAPLNFIADQMKYQNQLQHPGLSISDKTHTKAYKT